MQWNIFSFSCSIYLYIIIITYIIIIIIIIIRSCKIVALVIIVRYVSRFFYKIKIYLLYIVIHFNFFCKRLAFIEIYQII